ncbi:hypothetical protein Pint_14451 [Pistacia integerrima]|uniref:Uncharacterized protein n=1 Tax=Pistacia integerrima TaxID=434235 RepID=A0ACC0Y631_9ROSI|nr:hypothetical protein Pint_14451 [Pistacia integerrima]
MAMRGGAIKFLGTKRHHDKWLKDTENYVVKGCFAMTELGHGSNVKGIETSLPLMIQTTGEFVINTPCESAQKYCIGGATNHATQTVVFSQLGINGKNQGVHAFICQIRDADGKICLNIRIADLFDNVRIPKENLLNSIADVSPDGEYLSAIRDPDQRFAAFMAALTSGHVNIASTVMYISKVIMDFNSGLPSVAKLLQLYMIFGPGMQECREACGGQGLKTENHVGHLKSEFDVQSTFEGDNNFLVQ